MSAEQLALLALAAALLACGDDPLQRMRHQRKLLPYQQSPLFEDGRGMRVPPAGAVPRERTLASPEVLTGRAGGASDAGYLDANPLPATREVLLRGRRRFEITCAACHGLLGDGDSMVARNMALRPPPSLHDYRERPDGYFFEVITQGFGLMPSFGSELEASERWAVVAYLRALFRSQRAALEDAPEKVRRRLLEERGP